MILLRGANLVKDIPQNRGFAENTPVLTMPRLGGIFMHRTYDSGFSRELRSVLDPSV
jgi:hypothetical protein